MFSDNLQPRYHRYYVIAFDIPKKLFIFVGGGQKSIKLFLDYHKPTVTCNWIISKQIAYLVEIGFVQSLNKINTGQLLMRNVC